MKAPEKIYITPNIDRKWQSEAIDDESIEYTCTNAFIEKLECWMNENFYQYAGEFAEGILAQFDRTEDAIDSFRKYMEV